jgi:phosphoribosylformylglycinamidine (FGAM) synthase PurS component
MSTSTLNPKERRDEASSAAAWEGSINALLTLIPSSAAVALAMRNPGFRMRTNWQSRTALSIMPAFFVFTLTSEQKLSHKMKEIAQESQHNNESVKWAEQVHNARSKAANESTKEREQQLSELYRKSVQESGVSIVPGDRLGFHHNVANYTAANPFKVLAAFAVPSVAWIFYGQTGLQHVQFSVKLLHTRVFGQFATISLLLGVMGFKELMDKNGKFITQADADQRVEEMKEVRNSLMARLEADKQNREEIEDGIKQAHEEDVKDHKVHLKEKKNKKSNTIKEE